MRYLVVALLAAVQLGGAFGEASASVVEIDDRSMIIELSVEVKVGAQAVVAHLSHGDAAARPHPLLDRGGGVFGIRTELEPRNYVVVFEAVGSGMPLSEPKTLAELGAELARVVGTPTTAGDSPISRETRRLGWLVIALTAASLSALAFWALGGTDEPAGDDEEE